MPSNQPWFLGKQKGEVATLRGKWKVTQLEGKQVGGWVHVGMRGTFCTAMCSFLLDSQSVNESPIINTLLLSINATKQDWGELAKLLLLAERPPQSKPAPTTLRSQWGAQEKDARSWYSGREPFHPAAPSFQLAPIQPTLACAVSQQLPDGWSRLATGNLPIGHPASVLVEPCLASTAPGNYLLEMSSAFQGQRVCQLGLVSLTCSWQQQTLAVAGKVEL